MSNDIFSHTVLYLLARGVPAVVNFMTIVVLTRILTTEEYGQYAVVIATASLLGVISFQWLKVSLVRYFPEHESEPITIISTTFFCYVLVSVLALIIVVLCLTVSRPTALDVVVAIMALLLIWLQTFFELNLELLRIKMLPVKYGLALITKSLLALSMAIALIAVGLSYKGAIIALVMSFLAAIILFKDQLWHEVRISKCSAELGRLLVRYGAPISVTLILSFVVSTSDRMIINTILGSEPAGTYSAGYDLAQNSIGVLMMVVNLSGFPMILRAYNGNDGNTQYLLNRYIILLLSLTVPAALAMTVLAPNIASVVLGASFRKDAVQIIPIVSLAALLAGLKSYYFDLPFHLKKVPVSQTVVTLIAAITNILLNFVLIPQFGILGAAYATLLAYAVGLLLSIWYGGKICRFPFPKEMFTYICMASIAMMYVLHYFGKGKSGASSLALLIILGAATYCFVLSVTSIIRYREFRVTCQRYFKEWLCRS